jgi:hypothetical protein
MTGVTAALTAVFILAALLWKLAPGKTFAEILSLLGAEGLLPPVGQTREFHGSYLSATQCAPCHIEHFQEWSESVHARSLTSENFLKTFPQYLDFVGKGAREDPRTAMACFGCHAPLLKNAEPQVVRRVTAFVLAKETERLEGLEVGCIACHADLGGVFSGPIRDPQNNPFHSSKFSPAYEDGSFCAACHISAPSSIPCSDVYTDWERSRAAKQGRTCQSCHMAERSGIAATGGPSRKTHSHIFPGARSAAMLQQAVALGLKGGFRKDQLEVTATVRNLAPHRVPDG